ncbi:MAG: TetR/AcrR family transcriptional regulator [Bacteroidota bacterium]
MAEIARALPTGEKKSYILQKALSLFLSFGIRAVSMKDISDAMGISKKTLYSLFDTKEALLKACIKRLIGLQLKEIASIEEMPVSKVEKVFHIYKSCLRNIANQHSSFYYDMKRDYPNIYNFHIVQYRESLTNKIFLMLSECQLNQEVIAEIDLELFCEINFFKLDDFFSNKDIHQKNRQERILNHTILISLRGILRNPDSINWQ